LIYDPSEWQIEQDEATSRMKTDELDRLVAAGTIREVDRGRVRFIVRRIVNLLHDSTKRLLARSDHGARCGGCWLIG
jgi:hypothetical protein